MKLIRNSHIILLVLLLVIFQCSEENPGAWTVDKKINKKTLNPSIVCEHFFFNFQLPFFFIVLFVTKLGLIFVASSLMNGLKGIDGDGLVCSLAVVAGEGFFLRVCF